MAGGIIVFLIAFVAVYYGFRDIFSLGFLPQGRGSNAVTAPEPTKADAAEEIGG